MRKLFLAAVMVLALVGAAQALDLHGDYRYTYSECYTWGSGKYSVVQTHLVVKEGWDIQKSNYPTSWTTKAVCQYVGCKDGACKNDMPPALKPGEYLVSGSTCKTRAVISNVCANDPTRKCQIPALPCADNAACVPGTMPATSSPRAYLGYGADYNGGSSTNGNGCIWDPWAYGAPPA
jgi:hypothetical protein